MKVVFFAKPLRGVDIPAVVERTKALEADGVEWPVREGFAVNPGNVRKALPQLVKAMASEGLCVALCSCETRFVDAAAPYVEPMLATMAEHKVPYLKLGYFGYQPGQEDYWRAVARARGVLDAWRKLAEKHGVTVCCHTHSGLYLGSNAAGLMQLIRGFDPKHIAGYLDTGHLAVGGEEFPIACAMTGPYLKIVGVKDMKKVRAEEDGQTTAKVEGFPLGQGAVDVARAFRTLTEAGFDGPVSVHFEYEKGTPGATFEQWRSDVRTCRQASSP